MAKILLVEDDNNLREIFEMRLRAEGHTIVTAQDGEEALVVAMREKPELVISDVMMPKLSGFEMVETLKASPEMKNVKVIMMTALGQAEDRSQGDKLGVDRYLVKSQVTLEDFVRVAHEVLQGTAPAATSAANDTLAEPAVDTSTTSNEPTEAPATQPVAEPKSVSVTSTPSSAEEKNKVEEQIESFVSTVEAPEAPKAAQPADDDQSAKPVDSDQALPTTGNKTHEKVIKPLPGSEQKPSVTDLAAKEEQGESPAAVSAVKHVPAQNLPASESSAPAPSTPASDVGSTIQPTGGTTPQSTSSDPNSIAL